MANTTPVSVWQQMNYVPPRGQCNFKASVLSPKCPCLRFMLHPLKSSSSYDCDGCTHHASFHSMENKEEDEIRKRWEMEAKEKETQQQETGARARKRPRELEWSAGGAAEEEFTGGLFSHIGRALGNISPVLSDATLDGTTTASNRAKSKKGNGRGRQTRTRAGSTAARGKTVEEDPEFVEID